MSRTGLRTFVAGALHPHLAPHADELGIELVGSPETAALVIAEGLEAAATGVPIVVVAAPGTSAASRAALRREGALDAIEDGAALLADLGGVVAVASRLAAAAAERAALHHELAQAEHLRTAYALGGRLGHAMGNLEAALRLNLETLRGAIEETASRAGEGSALARRSTEWLEILGDTLAITDRIGPVRSLLGDGSRAAEAAGGGPRSVDDEIQAVVSILGPAFLGRAGATVALGAPGAMVSAPPHVVGQLAANLLVGAVLSIERAIPERADRRLALRTTVEDGGVVVEMRGSAQALPAEISAAVGALVARAGGTIETGTDGGDRALRARFPAREPRRT